MSELTAWFYTNHSVQVQNDIEVLITNCHGTPNFVSYGNIAVHKDPLRLS